MNPQLKNTVEVTLDRAKQVMEEGTRAEKDFALLSTQTINTMQTEIERLEAKIQQMQDIERKRAAAQGRASSTRDY